MCAPVSRSLGQQAPFKCIQQAKHTTRHAPSLRPSRPRHAILRPQADGINIEDLGSLNGSFVNEDRLEGTMVIRGGDVLQVGQTVVKITC